MDNKDLYFYSIFENNNFVLKEFCFPSITKIFLEKMILET